MRLLSVLLSALTLLPSALASAESPTARKISKFNAIVSSSKSRRGLIELTDTLYDDLTTGPRNFTAVVLLTALEARIGCNLCREFAPEFDLLAKSWNTAHKDGGGLFFAELDFANARTTFQKLQLTTAPVLLLFPPSVGPYADPAHTTPVKFDFAKNSIPAEEVALFIAKNSVHAPKVHRPYNWTKIGITSTVIIVSASALKLALPTLKPMLLSRTLWAALSLISILLFISGHMFNHIRKVPYVAKNGKGGVSYIAGGFSNQYGLETQIVAVMYAVLSFATISLAMKTPRIEDPGRQKAAIIIWNAVMLCAFSFLMNLFKQKNGSYPFYLPPMM
ncbi:oligosaccharyl transferase subunit ost3/OST6 [Maublancomyces gigas]|uniref:Oligosaccharyl transferase subunit ost3/OST6 n=1 Tax=Discina gigas TaxID=1032678 RepID=A0ABR3GSH5_9PEZI